MYQTPPESRSIRSFARRCAGWYPVTDSLLFFLPLPREHASGSRFAPTARAAGRFFYGEWRCRRRWRGAPLPSTAPPYHSFSRRKAFAAWLRDNVTHATSVIVGRGAAAHGARCEAPPDAARRRWRPRDRGAGAWQGARARRPQAEHAGRTTTNLVGAAAHTTTGCGRQVTRRLHDVPENFARARGSWCSARGTWHRFQ